MPSAILPTGNCSLRRDIRARDSFTFITDVILRWHLVRFCFWHLCPRDVTRISSEI